MPSKIPSYCRHKASGQAVVTIGGKDRYLGKYGSEPSHARYEKVLSEWLAGVNNDDVHTVVELCAAYFDHAQTYYVKDGKQTGEICKLCPEGVDRSLDPWEYRVAGHKTEHHGRSRVVYFGPQAQQILTKYLLRPGNQKCFDYTTCSFRRHIHRACHRLGIEPWGPNRLRHTKATDVRSKYGIDAARASLGHSSAATTETYALLDADKSRKIASDTG